MAQAQKEKLWLDRDLWQIPVLFCGAKDPDYKAIMSRFHYLLLKKDPETYEELIKYWAFLIVTAPDAFDEEPSKRYKHLIFSGVQETAIKLNRPIEAIELTPGEPKLEEANNFLYENWRVLFEQNQLNVNMDDLSVYRWYTEQTDIMSSRAFFGLYCLNLFQAHTDPKDSLLCVSGLASEWLPRPSNQISYSLATATFVRDAFRSQAKTFLKVLRMVLDWYEYHTDHRCQRSHFFENQIRKHFIYHSLEVMKFAMDKLDNEILAKLEPAIMEKGPKGVKRSLKSFNTIVDYLNGVRLQDESFLKVNPHLRGEQCRLWPYSRYISPLYFKSLDLKDNLEFLAFCVGYRDWGRGKLDDYLDLGDLIDDKHDRKSLEQEIERGWNHGLNVLTAELLSE